MRTKFNTIIPEDSVFNVGGDGDEYGIKNTKCVKEGRICKYPGCDTELRTRNFSVLCSIHERQFTYFGIDRGLFYKVLNQGKRTANRVRVEWAKKDAALKAKSHYKYLKNVIKVSKPKLSGTKRPFCEVKHLYELFTDKFLTREYHKKDKTVKEISVENSCSKGFVLKMLRRRGVRVKTISEIQLAKGKKKKLSQKLTKEEKQKQKIAKLQKDSLKEFRRRKRERIGSV